MLFRDALYAVELQVENPPSPQITYSWRLEIWQEGRGKPVAVTRNIRGIEIAGTMVASVEPSNQV